MVDIPYVLLFTLDIIYGSHESLHCLFNSDCSVLVDEGAVRVDGLVVELAVLVLHGVDDVPTTLQGQLDPQLRPPVTSCHHGFHLENKIRYRNGKWRKTESGAAL